MMPGLTYPSTLPGVFCACMETLTRPFLNPNNPPQSNPIQQALPEGTFGKSYSNFMKGNKFSPDSRSAVQYVDDPDLAYVMRR